MCRIQSWGRINHGAVRRFCLDAPAWQAIIPELVEREDLPTAVALTATGFNIARAIGPAIGGLIVAAAVPQAVPLFPIGY